MDKFSALNAQMELLEYQQAMQEAETCKNKLREILLEEKRKVYGEWALLQMSQNKSHNPERDNSWDSCCAAVGPDRIAEMEAAVLSRFQAWKASRDGQG